MKVEEIKAYAEEMISVSEKGGMLDPVQRSAIVTMAMSVCGRPFDEQAHNTMLSGAGVPEQSAAKQAAMKPKGDR